MSWRGGRSSTTSVIRLSRAGNKIAGSVVVVAEDEKTRRLNIKTHVAHAPRLIGCVPWIIPGRCCQHRKSPHANARTHAARSRGGLASTPSSVRVRSEPVGSHFCFGPHYTYSGGGSDYTSYMSSHLAPVLRHASLPTQRPPSFLTLSGFCFVHYRNPRCVQQTQK